MVYIPPPGDSVTFSLVDGYVPDDGDSVSFLMAPSGDATVVVSVLDQPYSIKDVVRVVLDQWYSISGLAVIASLEQVYVLASPVAPVTLSQIYGLRMLAMLAQPYADAPVILQQLRQYYGDSALLRRALVQLYNDALMLRQALDQPYVYPSFLQKILAQKYSISGAELVAVSEQLYSIKSIDLALAVFDQPFAILDGTGQLLSYTATVVAGGSDLGFTHLDIEASRDRFCLSYDVTLASQSDYVQCAILDDLTITIDGTIFEFFIESRTRNRGHATAEYTISGLSKTALLDAPYAEPVTGELSGLASAIVASLAAGYTVNWQTVDWYIPANTLMPADQTPLEVIRQIAAAAGAIIQTEPDGTLTIEPAYPVAVPDWPGATVDYSLSDAADFFTTGENFDHRPGYNRYLVSDQLTSDNTLRLESEAVTSSKKYIRAYQTPWTDDFDLLHTGGEWVTIEPMGIDERLIEDEVVEFIAGTGNTSYPIYERVSVEWLQANLGTVTFGEDGSLSASVEAESLLKISYRTKCRKYLVTDAKTEPVQLLAEEV